MRRKRLNMMRIGNEIMALDSDDKADSEDSDEHEELISAASEILISEI
jgi:hypothetical protein